jgi:hypothetical protein
MSKLPGGTLPLMSSRRILYLTVFLYLFASLPVSSPFDPNGWSSVHPTSFLISVASAAERRQDCESQYRQCIKDIKAAYTRQKMACEASFRQCQRR